MPGSFACSSPKEDHRDPANASPARPDNGLIAVDRYWAGMAGVVAGLRPSAALLKVSGANGMGEPNGEPTTTGIRPRQATSSHSRGWQTPRRAMSSYVQRRYFLVLQARGRRFEPCCAHQPHSPQVSALMGPAPACRQCQMAGFWPDPNRAGDRAGGDQTKPELSGQPGIN
jgi:hypothetical protein